MKLSSDGKLLRIFVGESDKWEGNPLYQAIVQLARKEGLAGATAMKGFMGFGRHSHMHTAKLLRLSEDLPVVIEIVDTAEHIERLTPILDEMVVEGLVTMEKVQVLKYASGTRPPS